MTDPAEGAPPEPMPNLRLRTDPPRVMRLSRKTLAIMGLVAGAGIGGSLIYALQPSHRQAAAELYNTEGQTKPDNLASAPKDYSQIPKLGPPLPGDLGPPIVSAQQRGVDVAAPPIGTGARAPTADTGANAAQAARQRAAQERDSARTSKLFLGADAPSGSDTAATPAAPGPLPMALPGATADTMAGQPEDTAQNGQASKRAFMKAEVDHRTTSLNHLADPPSPYVVQAGSVIAAALITGIRSDLPGQITAQVTENIYDSPTGRILLIPQGSKLVGEYDSQISFGQNRVLLAWDRLILPSGQSITLDRQPGADAAGFAGLQDRTNYHWGGMAKAALLSTVLGIGAEVGSNNDNDLVRAIRQGTSDTVNQAGQQIVRRQLNVQPTLTIRPGYPLRVLVTRDILLTAIAQEARR